MKRSSMFGVATGVAVLAASVFVAPARAVVPLLSGFGGARDFGARCLSPNDDGSSNAIDLNPFFPGGLRFFTTTHRSVHVNTNGNVTFSAALPQFTPAAFPIADQPMVAPYWADVDIRPIRDGDCRGLPAYNPSGGRGPCENPTYNGVWWHVEFGRMIVTWDQVGYYSCHLDKRMHFQLVLTAVEACGGTAGDFDVEFRFARCEWTTGDASGGTGGLGGTPAQVGFDAGNRTDFVQIPGSRTPTIHNIVCNDSNVGTPGLWRFQIRGGTIMCPDAGAPCDTGLLGVCALGRTSCVGAGTVCSQDVPSSPERCDALDNDCDGDTDEGEICLPWEICDRGICRQTCFEFGCPQTQVCASDGRCIEEGCEGMECEEGLRCVSPGVCVDACDGIVCPAGQVCRAGRCIDPCATLMCDEECQVCVDGSCEIHCGWRECPPGDVCLDDGRCLPEACAWTTCDPGFVCRDGACADACEGAVCPAGERCEVGEC
ncbi:MAG: nidogen-like domain-containing protein, partial [Myxococcota bacterium]|nr:nidogen-like domain-containing protein [Myxococcota bacterium]